ncbi:MAG: hypothetical protein LQ338_003251 [Usnochroma carphineum]|nr:MAG: hypothetical protein LQ338_003251 [Usnochroma carphineum]
MSWPFNPLAHQIFEWQAAKTPAENALEVIPGVRWTYHDLNATANRLARYLRCKSTGRNEVVALWLDKTDRLVIAVLAVLKAGMTWLPLPLDAPSARIAQILRSCEVDIILTSGLDGPGKGSSPPYVVLDEVLESPELLSHSTFDVGDVGRNTENLCHILFTSGSTGVPKGVKIQHRALTHNVKVLIEKFQLGKDTRTLQFAAPTFDIFSLDLFMTFACGGCLVMSSPSTILQDISSFIRQHSITYTQLTPTVIHFVDPMKVSGSLGILVSSGETFPSDLADKWRKRLRLFNAYGPTETIVCTVQDLSGNDIDSTCIGQAVDGLDVRMFGDDPLVPVAEGDVGQICVAGPQLFQGYCSVQQNMETCDFVWKGQRYYKTGDLGRMERCSPGSSTIRYLGRRDAQVKVHGIRVDLGDVEQSILGCPSVKNCTVVQPRRGRSAGRLCAILVPQPPEEMLGDTRDILSAGSRLPPQSGPLRVTELSPAVLETLNAALGSAIGNLPTHAIPSVWWPVKELPLTPSGKIGRKKLQDWAESTNVKSYLDHSNDDSKSEADQPVYSSDNNNTRLFQSVWAAVLGRPTVSINLDDSFIKLGANSLDVIEFVSKARRAGQNISFAEVYSAKTIRRLASRRQEPQVHRDTEKPRYMPFSLIPCCRPLAPTLVDVAGRCNIGVANIEDIYPCTPYQAGLMVLDLRHPGSYVCAFSWTLPQSIDISRFRSAWDKLKATEPVLRNRLIWEANAQAFWQVTVRHMGMSGLSKEELGSPMALGHDLCRGGVNWNDETQRWMFHVRIHHSIIDGWSLRLMLNRLRSLYVAKDVQPPSGVPFVNYIRYHTEQQAHEGHTSAGFWSQYFRDFSPYTFPPPPSDPHHEIHATAHRSFPISVDLRATAAELGVTAATILYGAAALVLSAHSDREDLTFGLILAGRDIPLDGISQMIGPAFVTFPFRTHVDRQSSLESYLQGLERQILEIIPHQQYGLQRIKQCGQGASAACDFGCLIVVQPEDELLAGEGLWEKAHGQTSGLADNVPLSFELILSESQVMVRSNYDPILLPHEEVNVLLGHLNHVVRSLANTDPQCLVSEVKFAVEDEHSRMLKWSLDYGSPVRRCLHELFLDSVQKYPDRHAIDEQGTARQYSYKEVDTISYRLSRVFRFQYGIATGAVVPIALGKSALAIVAILAVLRAGAAYVPIDPSWPLERVRHILDQVGATVIVSSTAGPPEYSELSQKVVEVREDSEETMGTGEMEDVADPSSLALVMYTSGSTGVPKGVLLEHVALSTSLTHLARLFDLKPGTRHLQFSSFVYDVSVADMFIPWQSGACVCIPTEDSRRNRLSMTMGDMAIESAILTPSVVGLLSPEDCSTLQTLMTGGEMSQRSLVQGWAPRVRLVNAYGPTEASITTTVTDRQLANADPSNIGKNVTGWHWIVRQANDGEIYPVPFGCVGEIAIAGHSLARGYLQNDSLTDAHFVEVPTLAQGTISGRIYLTGDLGRYMADGTMQMIGRKDRMVKVNGIRIDPGEPESHLRQLGGIFVSSVVDCVRDRQGNAKLAAFVEIGRSKEKGEIGPEEDDSGSVIAVDRNTPVFVSTCRTAQRRLLELIPPRNVPTLFVPIRRIPYTKSDKVDLKSLRSQLQETPNFTLSFGVNDAAETDVSDGEVPTTPAAIALEAAFRSVFDHHQRLTTAADFFHLGGDSFLAIKLASTVRDHGYAISVEQVYRHSVLGDLAAAAVPSAPVSSSDPNPTPAFSRGEQPSRTPCPDPAPDPLRAEVTKQLHLPPDAIEDLYPASPFQEGLAAIALQDSGSVGPAADSLYNATITYRLAEAVDIVSLDQALARVVSTNPIFRTTLVSSSQGILQLVHRSLNNTERGNQEGPSNFHWWIDRHQNHLVLSISHALYDAFTMEHLLEDVTYIYNHPHGRIPARKPYRRFVEYLSRMDQEAARSYWGDQLRNAPLPRFPRLPQPHYEARATEHIQGEALLHHWNIRTMKLSAATVIAAATALILSAYCYADDVCYGMILSGRDDPELEDIAGPTLSAVPMRIGIHGEASLADILSKTQETLLCMRRYQHYGLQNITRLQVDGAKNASRFRTLLVVQHHSPKPRGDRDEEVVQGLIPEKTSLFVNYPLVLIAQVESSTGAVTIRLEYDSACISTDQANIFLQQFQHLLPQCTALDKTASEVDLLTVADRMKISSWNPTIPPPAPFLLQDMVRQIVAQQPNRPAIESCGTGLGAYQHLSYRQLDEHATVVSECIESSGSRSTRIGLCLRKSPFMVIAMLGIWKAGRAFVILDPSAPWKRQQAIVEDLGADVAILTEPGLAPLFASSTTWVLDPSLPMLSQGFSSRATASRRSELAPVPRASDMAYIMYTSGSSGTPKGVVVSHSAIATSLSGVASVMSLHPGTRMLQFASFTFDTCLLEIFSTLITGGCICMPSDDQRLREALTGVIRQLRVDQLVLTPTVAQAIDAEDVPSVQSLMLVGEPPTRHLLEKWAAVRPDVRVMNGYGPTEAAVHASTNPKVCETDPQNIGYPTACSLFITVPDRVDRLAAIGTVGELVVCGHSLAEGYLHQPESTSQAFGLELPWMLHSWRYYRTGDLARYEPDGSLVYLGRKDFQVKIHGQRIELGDIEWHLRNHGEFEDCIVDVAPSQKLVAFLRVGDSQHDLHDGPLSPESLAQDVCASLRTYLKSVLPEYMVPTIYLSVSSMPKTVSGKIDRIRLRESVGGAIDSYRCVGKDAKRQPRTSAQRLLSEVWAEAIPITEDQIENGDTISTLGGDSVSLIRILAGLRRRGISLSVTKAHQHDTLVAMAEALVEVEHRPEGSTCAPAPFSLLDGLDRDAMIAIVARKCSVSSYDVLDVYPCTAMQDALMISSAKQPGAFFNQEVFELASGTSVPRLIASLQEVWARHQILRTRIFLDEDYQSFQVVVNETLGVSSLEEEDIQAYLRKDAEAVPGYGDRLSRCAIIQCGSHTYLVFTRHHAIIDGWSQNVFLADIRHEYNSLPRLLSSPTPFSSFVRGVQTIGKSPEAQKYWQELLTGASASKLPQLRPVPTFVANQRHTVKIAHLHQTDYSFSTIAEAAWGILLGRYTQTEDVTFGTIRSGRTLPVDGIDSVLGPTIVTVPRRLQCIRARRVTEYLEHVNTRIREASPWEHYGPQRIRKLGPGAEKTCKFRSLIVVQTPSPASEPQGDSVFIPKSSGEHVTRSDCLMVECQPQEHDQLVISLTYDDRVISSDDIRWIAYHYSRLLFEITHNCDTELNDLNMAGPEDITQVQKFNRTGIARCPDRVDELFVERSKQWADSIAVEASDATLSYRELDMCSSRLAVKLKGLGVMRGSIVPLFMTRSAAMVVAMLAVLKVAAAYAPVAIDTPRERMLHLLDRINAQHVVYTSDNKVGLIDLPVRLIECHVQTLISEKPNEKADEGESRGGVQSPTMPERRVAAAAAATAKARDDSLLAYVLFTSGSTGIPKGVLIDHAALATTILENGRKMEYHMRTRTLSFAAYTFDVNVMEVYLTLLHGGCLCIPNEQQRLGDLCGYMNDKKIELALLTPTVVKNLLQSPANVPSLKTLRVGGEPLSQAILKEWSPHLRLINSYGPTETCVDACRNAHVTANTDSSDIGHAIGTHLWVVEPGNRNRLAPIGCPGELLVSGPTLARGYLGDDGATREAFIDGSSFNWTVANEDRLYCTGDIVRQNPDGSINFLGRADLQTKVNGFRIEVEEVQSVIESGEGINAAVVEKVQLQDDGTEILVAFLTVTSMGPQEMRGGLLPSSIHVLSAITEASIRTENTLLPYMRPHFYLPMQSIPLTTSGKADRRALQQLFAECSREQLASYRSSPGQKRSPVTNTQRILQGLWAQILSLSPGQIGLDSRFIGLGGESLAAIKLGSLCREIGFQLDISDILRNSSLEQMAMQVEGQRNRQQKAKASRDQRNDSNHGDYDDASSSSPVVGLVQVAEACGLQPEDVEEFYPCTPTQKSLMAVTARVPEAYIARERYRLATGVDPARVRAAWELVHRNNPILRSRICSLAVGGQATMVQVVCKDQCDWAEVSDTVMSASAMGLGESLVRYRILKTSEGTILELTKHHAIYDGFCSKLIWDDFRHAYSNLAQPPPHPSYRKYIDYLRSQNVDESTQFWRACLDGFQSQHFPASPSEGYVATASSQSSQTVQANVGWDKSCPYTLASVVRAAWAVCLAMRDPSTGVNKDVCFASTSSGRALPLPDVESMTGPTITTVPVRISFDLDLQIRQYLAQVHEQSSAMLKHEHFPLSQIRKVSDAAQHACKTTSLLVIQPAPMSEPNALPAVLEQMEETGQGFIETYGLVIECSQSQDQKSMTLSVSHDPVLLHAREALHLIQQLSRVIAMFNNQCTVQDTIRMATWGLAKEDVPRMLEWQSISQPDPLACLHEIVEDSAKLHPMNFAVDAHDAKLRYRELDVAGDALAVRLQTQYDIRPGDLVPLCAEKSSMMIVAMLGVLKAGGGYVSLDISCPQARLEHILQETHSRVVVVSPLQARSRAFSRPIIVLNRDTPSTPTKHFKRHSVSTHDIAYVTFTSGSTGPPKGVVTEHGAARLSVLEHGKRYQHNRHGGRLRALQYSSYTFDASVLDIFATLAYGGCLCVPSEEERMESLEDFMIRKKVNFADLTPTIARLLNPTRLPNLKVMAIGGEMANRSVINKWTSSESPLEHFVNSYGPTEAAIGCAVGEICQNVAVGRVGKSVGASLWVVDATNHDHLVPVACGGELVISGHTLAREYLNDPELTRKAFIQNSPWLKMIGETRFYKTGDIARMDLDGNVEILGRKEDDQVKLHGLRLELGEIETAMRKCPSLASARHVSAARVELAGAPTIAAFVQLSEDTPSFESIFSQPSPTYSELFDAAEEAMRQSCQQHIVPRVWLPVSSWPLTSSGKTDRRGLVAACEALNPAQLLVYQRSRSDATEGVGSAPMTDTETMLANAWREVLRKDARDMIKPQDDFFRLGGDSLGVIMLIPLLNEQGIRLTAQEVFATKDLRGMASLAESRIPRETHRSEEIENRSVVPVTNSPRRSSPVSSSSEPFSLVSAISNDDPVTEQDAQSEIERNDTLLLGNDGPLNLPTDDVLPPLSPTPEDSEDIFPASHTQLGFLIEGQKWCRSYYAWSFLNVKSEMPINEIRERCHRVTVRHPILRTSFHLIGVKCYQAVRRPAVDFKVLVYNGQPDAMCAKLYQDVQRPVAFGSVLTRFRLLIDRQSGRHTLALGLSHAQYDGFCLSTILNDLCSARTTEPASHRPSPSYRSYVEYHLRASNEGADAFWKKALEGSKLTSIVRGERPSRQPVMGPSIKKIVPFRSKHVAEVSYPAMLKATWALVLSRLSQSVDVTFGDVISGRMAGFDGAQAIVGPCLNVIPARIVVNAQSSVKALLCAIEEQQVAAIPYQSTSLERIAQLAAWPASARFQCIFQYQNIPNATLPNDDAGSASEWTYAGNAVYGGGLLQSDACWLMAWPEQDGHVAFRFTFAPQTLSAAAAETILDLCCKTLQALNDSSEDATVSSVLSIPYNEGTVASPVPSSTEDSDSQPDVHDPEVPIPLARVAERLRSLWKQTLRYNNQPLSTETVEKGMTLSHDDSFFDIGGDSISAARLAMECTRDGLELAMQDIIDFPTLRQQTLFLAGELRRPMREIPTLAFSADYKFN